MFVYNRWKGCLRHFEPANWDTMSRNLIKLGVFAVGLAAVCGIGVSYVGSNLVALAVTLLIGACYVTGALELHRYRQATFTLEAAVSALADRPPALAAWIETLHPSLRNAVRLRVEGERAALPGPSLSPYLVGLLVLLGMLGTLLGMVGTLKGTGAALESATDLAAIRASLAAPVKGLGFAFGTSIAGVATSAMLGLLSTLCRRERMHATQLLDAKCATTLRVYSQTHQREETLELLRVQAQALPALMQRLQDMMGAIERQSAATGEHQLATQAAFHDRAEAAYVRLAASVEASLKETIEESTRAAGAALQPVAEATMAGLARETATLRETVSQAVERQLQGLSAGFETSSTAVARVWQEALTEHQRSSEALAGELRASLGQFVETLAQRSADVVTGVSGRLDGVAGALEAATAQVAQNWTQAFSAHRESSTALMQQLEATLDAFAARFDARSSGLVDGVAARLDTTALRVSDAWTEALAQHVQTSERLIEANRQAWTGAAATFEQQAATLVRTVGASHTELQAQLSARDEARLALWAEKLGGMTDSLNDTWQQAGSRIASGQERICETLARTAAQVSAQTSAHAGETIAEISRLVQAASEAPRVAAEVVAELRQKLSDSMVRDTEMLEERTRLLATLETLLGAVNHASTEQRTAVDALIATSSNLLDRVGTQFSEKVDAETGKLGAIAAQVTGSAVEVASLGEACGAAVERFGASNDALLTQLTRIEAALDKSLARSDEQLAYYVAQAKEVIDLSMMSQKQIVEELQQLAAQRASAGADAA